MFVANIFQWRQLSEDAGLQIISFQLTPMTMKQ